MIQIKDLSISFQGKPVLQQFCADIKEGSTVAIMGHSGIGKSTLLKIMMGLQAPDSGEIIGLADKRISAVFQEDRLCEYLSAIKNVIMVLDGTQKKEIAREHLTQLISKDDIYKQVRTLSGGMKRRVSVARAFAYPSDLILMDEPFSGLDEMNKQKTIDYMLKYRNNRTMIVVTHEAKDADALMANQVIKLMQM